MHLRQPAVAGRFYTDVPADLRAGVESFLKQGAALPASALAAGDAAHLAGLMLPHAGHVYSGRVIGTGEKQSILGWLRALPLEKYTVLVCDFANWADTAPLPCLVLKK